MRRRARLLIFLPAVAGFAVLFIWGLAGLSPVGNYPGPYGDVINKVAVGERQVTDMVSAVNFDYRGFDTLCEEFIFFASVMGVMLLLRKQEDEKKGTLPDERVGRSVPRPSDAVRVASMLMIGTTLLFGLYIVTHGNLTPGGGFQGGVLIFSAILLLYLAGNFDTFKKLLPHQLVEITESLGAGGFALTGLARVVVGATYMENVLPLGQAGEVLSGGTMFLLSIVTGLEVTSGLFLICSAYLEDMLEHYRDEKLPKSTPRSEVEGPKAGALK